MMNILEKDYKRLLAVGASMSILLLFASVADVKEAPFGVRYNGTSFDGKHVKQESFEKDLGTLGFNANDFLIVPNDSKLAGYLIGLGGKELQNPGLKTAVTDVARKNKIGRISDPNRVAIFDMKSVRSKILEFEAELFGFPESFRLTDIDPTKFPPANLQPSQQFPSSAEGVLLAVKIVNTDVVPTPISILLKKNSPRELHVQVEGGQTFCTVVVELWQPAQPDPNAEFMGLEQARDETGAPVPCSS